ncbi:MAG: FAD:protein FMN transferase [Candidatus Tectomicrobia bacterium]|uniref:FAD:protein FMN transferase n=1 Tax=Tectimicrobiota bacterium TaxID=2528274 RepID=A0A933LRI9_UNCTE|nr:FAD:protein FMN transferase [Candidatus Tectomicrobia bacterium]
MPESPQLLADGSVLAHKGPMFLNILAIRKRQPDAQLARAGVVIAFSLLDTLAKSKDVIISSIVKLDMKAAYPPVVRRMITAVLDTGDKTLTPLAAVAGAVSDEVADFIFQHEGVSKVVVNNGGDIAIRLRDNEVATVGINLDCSRNTVSAILTIREEAAGVATSGFGGRSFTKGIASASVVWAQSASLADALATILGNATNADDGNVQRRLAEEIYPGTDIPGHLVTTSVGEISAIKVEEALEGGTALVRKLRQQGLVFEALLAVKGQARATDRMLGRLEGIASIWNSPSSG